MTDKSVFTDDEWHALTDAPLLVTAAVFIVGEHGPISMVKEASASARAISRPGERGVANELIGQIVAEANTKETRARTERAPRSHTAGGDREHAARPRARGRGAQEAAAGRIRTGCGLVRGDRRSGRAVGQEGQSRRAGDDREDRRTLRRLTVSDALGLVRDQPAVDEQHLAGHEARRVGREEQRPGRPSRRVTRPAGGSRPAPSPPASPGGLARTMSVSTVPGASAFTRMPRGAKSAAIARVNDMSPALPAAYIATFDEKRNAPGRDHVHDRRVLALLQVRQRLLDEEHRARAGSRRTTSATPRA